MAIFWAIAFLIFLFTIIALLIYFFVKVRRQKVMLQIQSVEIEKQVRELTIQNQKQTQLNHEKQQLILLVSHDLKGPFNRIFALTQLLEMTGQFSDEQKEYINKMYSIVGDGLNMVRNIVDVRKIEEKGLDPYPEKLNLPSVVLPIIKQYSVLAEKKKIKVNYNAPEKLEIFSDKNYISRVMENLLSNALKFSESGKEVNITITHEGNKAKIAVADNGPGLSEDDLKNLYQKFRKLTPRPTGGESSQGLGLSIVKILSEVLGGDVVCDSTLGAGSTFTVTISTELKKT